MADLACSFDSTSDRCEVLLALQARRRPSEPFPWPYLCCRCLTALAQP